MSRLRVLRVCHAGGDSAHRARDRALQNAGVDVTLVLPSDWPGSDGPITDVPHRELPVQLAGDVNRHSYRDANVLTELVRQVQPDLLDIHEEPVSLAARQWLRAAGDRPIVMYTAQNLDKRWPPPFAQYERAALDRVRAFYPCSAQAASVLRGKGFRGLLTVLPLGLDTAIHVPGQQALPAQEITLGLVGRLVPEKGVDDAVRVLAAVHRTTTARLLVIGEGPAAEGARRLSHDLGVAERCTWLPWSPPQDLAALYRQMHVVLVPSRATTRWVEQYGRVVTEGRANGAVSVAYASGSLPEVVGNTGITVPDGDAGAMAGAVVELVRSPERWEAMRQHGLGLTPQHSWEQVAASQIELYERARGSTSRPHRRPTAVSRHDAATEFGPTAATPGGIRPFAVPVLRGHGRVGRVLGRVVDAMTKQA